MALRSKGGRVRDLLAVGGAVLLLTGSAVVMAQPASDPAKPVPPAPGQPGQPGERPPRGPGGGGREGREGGPGAGREFNSVESAMKGMRAGMRMLKDTVGKPEKKEEALAAVTLLEKACLAAKTFKPEKLKAGANIDDYRRAQIQLMGMLLELETDIIDGKSEQAKEVAAKLLKFRDDSHAKFGEGDDDHAPGTNLIPPAEKK